jgi:Flp pilus assembly protein TadG
MKRNSLQKQTQTCGSRRGVTVAELSIVLPVFLMIVFAGFEFSRICLVRNAAHNAAYQAARRVMVPGATVADANAEASRLLSVFGVSTFTLTVNPNPITLAANRVTVSVDIPADQCGWIAPMFTTSRMIHAGSTLFAERDRTY